VKGAVLYSHSSLETGQRLASALGAVRINNYSTGEFDYLLRWGCSGKCGVKAKVEINSIAAVESSSIKPVMIRKLRSAGVSTPKVYLSIYCSNIEWNCKGKVLRRVDKPLSIVNSRAETINRLQPHPLRVSMSYYLMDVIEKDIEYRVYVWLGKMLMVDVKVGDRGNTSFVRKLSSGFKYERVEDTSILDPRIISESEKSVKSIGLDFGAVDVATGKDGGVYVFEVNSAPGMLERKCEVVAEAMKRCVEAM